MGLCYHLGNVIELTAEIRRTSIANKVNGRSPKYQNYIRVAPVIDMSDSHNIQGPRFRSYVTLVYSYLASQKNGWALTT